MKLVLDTCVLGFVAGILSLCQGAEKSLLLARRDDIRQIFLDVPDFPVVVLNLTNIGHAIALDYDSSTGFLYWADDEANMIQRAQLDGSEQEAVVDTEVIQLEGIAVDWIAQNLYWTDTEADHIEVSRVDGTSRKVLISDGLDQPRAICLDPNEGYMYWSDWGDKPVIGRAYLDGSHRSMIVSTDLGWPNALTIDLEQRKLFWGDAREDRIEVANLDGSNRRTLLLDTVPHVFGLTLLGDYIYWTDWQTSLIEKANKHTGLDRTVISKLPNLMGLKAVEVQKPLGNNACGENNGNCSHLCLYRPHPLGLICACPAGMDLLLDNKTCMFPTAFLLCSGQSDVRRESLDTNSEDQPIPIQFMEKATTLDFDIKERRIYWVDLEHNHINRAFMNGSAPQHIIQFGLGFPESIAIDWVARNIYWADTGKKRIEVARLDGSSRKVLVWRNLEAPKALALDPPNGYMYWAVWEPEPVLERANLDGSNRQVLIHGIGHVQDLTIDYENGRLYWTELKNRTIKSANLDGSDISTVVHSDIGNPVGITQYQDFVYWTDMERRTIEKADKMNGENRTLVQGDVNKVMDVLVVHASRQNGTNACGFKNGDCSHLCFAHSADGSNNGTHHCGCPDHYTLNPDGRNCSESPPKPCRDEHPSEEQDPRTPITQVEEDHHTPEDPLPEPSAATPLNHQTSPRSTVPTECPSSPLQGPSATPAATMDGRVERILRDQSTRVILNVGGKKFDTSIETLTSQPSLLADVVEAGAAVPHPHGTGPRSLFLDQDPTLFRYLLYFLRRGQLYRDALPREDRLVRELRREAEFYGLIGLARQLDTILAQNL